MFRLFGLLMLFVLPAEACKWDRDTLKEEAKGNLDTVKAITGWFDRYPARYYEIRLERVAKEVADHPENLDLYDDAGVAADRLGRFDEAIEWMARKNAALKLLPASESFEHRYRYLANLGSFYMDRWISREPEIRNANLDDLREAEKLVAEAIELNPDAHFGRERYQLQMIRWLLASDPVKEFDYMSFLEEPTAGESFLDEGKNAVAGLTGLVLMGEGWMSIDVFGSLYTSLLNVESASIAELAFCRVNELEKTGSASLHPSAEVRTKMQTHPMMRLSPEKRDQAAEYFLRARAAAEARRSTWIAYQDERYGRGMHPDTNPEFWDEWSEPEFPAMPGLTLWEFLERNPRVTLLFLTSTMVGGFGLVCWRLKRRSKLARA